MTWWGVNLDAISMITICMSIGYSVDFSAHVTYGYVVSKGKTSSHRVCDAISDLGWPVVQGATSTILGVVTLATVDAYMIVTFFKTVFLVMLIGGVHAMVFLPVLLSMFVRTPKCLKRNKKGGDEAEPSNLEEEVAAQIPNGTKKPSKLQSWPYGPYHQNGTMPIAAVNGHNFYSPPQHPHQNSHVAPVWTQYYPHSAYYSNNHNNHVGNSNGSIPS